MTSSSAAYLEQHAAEYYRCPGLRAMIRKAHCKQLLARPTIDQMPVDFLGILGPIVRPPACLVCPMASKFGQSEARPIKTASMLGSSKGRAPDRSSPGDAGSIPAPDPNSYAPVNGSIGQCVPRRTPAQPGRGAGGPRKGPPPTPGTKNGGSSNQDTGAKSPGNRGSNPRPPTKPLSFGSRLKISREKAGLTKVELSKTIGVPVYYITCAENGRTLNRSLTQKLKLWMCRMRKLDNDRAWVPKAVKKLKLRAWVAWQEGK